MSIGVVCDMPLANRLWQRWKNFADVISFQSVDFLGCPNGIALGGSHLVSCYSLISSYIKFLFEVKNSCWLEEGSSQAGEAHMRKTTRLEMSSIFYGKTAVSFDSQQNSSIIQTQGNKFFQQPEQTWM